jgi:hypothetical protein
MRKDILAKALRYADKSTVKPQKAIVASPRQIKTVAETLSHRLYTRITPTEFRRMQAVLGHGVQQ